MKNTFVAFLDLLNVKHTKSFSGQYFNEHPHKNNLYGLSEMLFDYKIRNAATRIEDKENDLFNLKCPFVAYMGSDFVVVEKGETGEIGQIGETGKIHIIRNGKQLSIVMSFVKSRIKFF